MASSFSLEARSDSHKIGETRYRMSHLPSTTAIARTLLLAGILLAVTVLAARSFLPAFAQEATTSDEKVEGYLENSTDPVIAFTATDPEGTQVTWSLGSGATSPDSDDFDITNGVLTFENPPNHESPTDRSGTGITVEDNDYVVQVIATDADNDTHTVTVTVTVTNVEEPGVIGTEGLEHPNAGVQITASLTDPDWVATDNPSGNPPTGVDPEPTWQWATSTSAGGPWNDIDTESAATNTYTPRDSDVDSYLRVTATYADVTTRDDATTPDVDESEDKAHKVFSTTVQPSGEDSPPSFPVQDDEATGAERTAQERRVSENAEVDDLVGDPVVANTDNLADGSPDTLSYSLVDDTNVTDRTDGDTSAGGDSSFFKIDSATGQISVRKEGLNYEAAGDGGDKTYNVIVRATDTSGQSTTTKVASEVIDIREAPKMGDENADNISATNDNLAARSVDEGTAASTVLSTYAATDDEDENADLKWSLEGNDKGRFELSANTGATVNLTFKEIPDFEDLSSVQKRDGLKLEVVVEDSHGLTDSRDVTVTVENVEEPGNVTLARVQGQVGTSITASLSDPDGSASSLRWQWVTSSNNTYDDSDPRTEFSTSNAYTPVAEDEGDYLFARASYTDPQGADKTAVSGSDGNQPVKLKNEYCTATTPVGDDFRCTRTASGNNPPTFSDQDVVTAGFQHATMTISEDVVDNPATRPIESPVTAIDETNVVCGTAISGATGCHNLTSATSSAAATLTATTTETDRLTYSLEGTDAGSFGIDRATGQISTKATLNYEDKDTYSVRVRATDPSGGTHTARTDSSGATRTHTIDVTINVTDEPEGPEITGGATTIRVNENTPVATVLSTYTATDDEDDKAKEALAWSLDNTSDAIFSIEGGQLKFKESPNFEALAGADVTRTVTVTVTDSANTTDTRTVEVTVIDVEEVGSIEAVIVVSGVESEVRRPRSGTAITAKLTDPDWATSGDPDDEITAADTSANLTWQWATSTSATGPWNDIDGAATNTYEPGDSDVDSHLRVTATYVDGTTEDDTTTPDLDEREDIVPKVFSATVLPSTENKPPAFPVQNSEAMGDERTAQERRVSENAEVDDLVGAEVVATDTRPDGNPDRLVYSLEADADENERVSGDGTEDISFFKIDSETGQISVKKEGLNYEAPGDAGDKTYNVLVKATDTSMASTTVKVEIKIVDVREAPEIGDENNDNLAARSVEEKTATSTVLSTYQATDDEDDQDTDITLDWSLEGADKDTFVLCKEDTFGPSCTDSTSDTPDPDTGNIVSLRFKEEPDFEARSNNMYRVTVVATDSDGQTASRNVVVTLTNVEEDGEVTLSNRQPEVGIPITASLTDSDGGVQGTTWQWYRAADASATCDPWRPGDDVDEIPNATSRTYTPVATDADTVSMGRCLYPVATYTDNHRPEDLPGTSEDESQEKDMATGTSAFFVQRMDSNNQVPVFPNQNEAMTIRISESTAEGAPLGGTTPVAVQAQDDDDNLTYTLGGADAGFFTIDTTVDGGQISVGKGTKLDYDQGRRSYTVTVTATDPSLASATITVTIEVVNENEAPEVSAKGLAVAGLASVSYAEDRDDAVETYVAQGDEAAGASWSLAGNDSSAFSIAGGVLRFNTQPNFEAPADAGTDNVYNVTVRAIGATISASKEVTVTVTNVDEGGSVNISSPNNEVKVGVQLTAELDEGDEEVVIVWQWASGPAVTGPWSNISGETSSTYTPVEGDVGNYLQITVTYTDATFGIDSLSAATASAVAPESTAGTPGALTLSPTTQLTSGDTVTATLTDADNPVNQAWLWQRSVDGGSTNWTTISTATSASYTTVNADGGNYLRASVTYTDDSGTLIRQQAPRRRPTG